MFKVPFYTFSNYQNIISKPYDEQDVSQWIDFKFFVELLTNEFVKNYAQIDARKIGDYIEANKLKEEVKFGNLKKKLEDILVASKLIMPTLWACDYFMRNCHPGLHCGIDVLLPQGTPILSFTGGKVFRIKLWDGQKKDEGNCVVIKMADKYYSYKHLDTIKVKQDQEISKNDIIGTCGSTGNSTQFHLHFQVDPSSATFHPYRSNQNGSILKYTLNPLTVLQKIFSENVIFEDMPDGEYKIAIESLLRQDIISKNNKTINPNDTLPRRQLALLINRIAEKKDIYKSMPIVNHNFIPYIDLGEVDEELEIAIKNLQKYGLMVGQQNHFYLNREASGEELLSLLGRALFRLKDSEDGHWYTNYLNYFQSKRFLDYGWKYIGQAVKRKEAFLIIYRSLEAM